MKAFKWMAMGMLVASLAVFSCKDEDENATCTDGIQNQDETGVDCGGICTACKVGVHGEWKSYPVAPILANFADSIIATFETNNTYVVDSWKNGSKTVLSGTYVQTKSSTGNIWTIVLEQSSPTVLTSEGMFEVTDNDTKMTYEIVQTNPAIGAAPPTPAAGFGSSTFNGTALGAANIQNYVRIQ
jgi:hypothetical protein